MVQERKHFAFCQARHAHTTRSGGAGRVLRSSPRPSAPDSGPSHLARALLSRAHPRFLFLPLLCAVTVHARAPSPLATRPPRLRPPTITPPPRRHHAPPWNQVEHGCRLHRRALCSCSAPLPSQARPPSPRMRRAAQAIVQTDMPSTLSAQLTTLCCESSCSRSRSRKRTM